MASNKEILEQAEQDYRQDQEQELVINFDKFVEEQGNPTISIKFNGEDYEAPAKLPIGISIKLERHLMDGALSNEKAFEILRDVFGSELMEAMEDSNQPVEYLLDGLLIPLFEQWGYVGVEGSGSKKK